MRFSTTLLLAAMLGLAAIPAAAAAGAARCVVKTAEGRYAGPCRFSAERGGSFNIAPVGRAEFFKHEADDPGITDIRVDVAGTDADVHGLTTSGVNARWGEAKRSKPDRACWVGDDFSICVY